MRHSKSILYLLAPALFLGASCTQTITNTNTVSATNENTNTEVVVNTNDNTNTVDEDEEEGIDINTSDWKFYQNDTVNIFFKYPQDWQLVRTQEGEDFTELIDNNGIYDHQLVNLYIHWSERHEDITYESGVINQTLDRWLSCDYIYDLQSTCSTILVDGIEVIQRTGQIEPPFGDDYVALAYKKNDFTVVIDGRSLLRESANNTGNNNLDGLDYINAIIETMSIN